MVQAYNENKILFLYLILIQQQQQPQKVPFC